MISLLSTAPQLPAVDRLWEARAASEVQITPKKHANLRKLIVDLPAEYRASIIENSPWIIEEGNAP